MKRMRTQAGPWRDAGRIAALAAVIGFLSGAARADDGDPPGRVARLSETEGSVSLEPAGVDEWTTAQVNRPLTTGDRLWTSAGSRAELDLGAAVIRLGDNTGFSFFALDDRTAQMQLAAGTLIVEVRDLQPGDNYEIDTPNIALTLQQPGAYRVEASDADATTVVRISEGAAEAAGGGETVAIGPQQSVRFTGTDTLTFASSVLGTPDDLDNWSAARERQAQDSSSG
ncbi:MAG: FecR domain-containing protein, partial [Gammaproteobacteria bacterium]|nr:FecR domain-containing protein [Gammaproteobacteria bacterium]